MLYDYEYILLTMGIRVISIFAMTKIVTVSIGIHVSCVASLALELLHHGICPHPTSLENPRLYSQMVVPFYLTHTSSGDNPTFLSTLIFEMS